jgi:hypothetical protein
MLRIALPLLACMVLLLPMLSWAQAQPNSPIPVSAGGPLPAAAPTSEPPLLTNVFGFGLELGSTFDSNEYPSITHPPESDIRYSVMPRFSLSRTFSRVAFNLEYDPGVDISEHRLYRTYFYNSVAGDVTYTPTERTTFTAQQKYVLTTDPLRGLGGPINSSGETTYLPGYLETGIQSFANLSHRFSDFDAVGVGGSFADTSYDTNQQGQPTVNLIRSRVSTGNIYYTHQNSAHNSVGAEYQAVALEFPAQNARTFTHSFLFLDTITFSPTSSLTLSAGPDYAITHNQVVESFFGIIITIPFELDTWSWTASGVYTHQWTRSSLQAQFARQVSNGGGLLSAVQANDGRVNLRVQVTKKWEFDMRGDGAVSNLISAASSTNSQIRLYSGQAGFNRKLSEKVSLDFYYRRTNQAATNLDYPVGNHNIAGVSLNFQFLRPIGR